MHSIASLVFIGSALLGQPAGVTESELPPPGTPRTTQQPPRTLVPEVPATTAPDTPVFQTPAPRTPEEPSHSGRPVAAFWFVLPGS